VVSALPFQSAQAMQEGTKARSAQAMQEGTKARSAQAMQEDTKARSAQAMQEGTKARPRPIGRPDILEIELQRSTQGVL
jgi:hypothetical protein